MTTPFDNGPANPFADNSTPAPAPAVAGASIAAANAITNGEAVNPFAGVPAEQPIQAPAPQQPIIADPFGAAQPTSPPVAPQSPTTFAAPPALGRSGGNGRKYKIFDLYWLVNLKLYREGVQLIPNEVAVLNISYNIDFDNLRLSFCTPGANTFTQTGMELKSMDRKTTVNICAEVAEQLTDLLAAETGQVNNLERVFQNNDNWTPNQTTFIKNGNSLICTTNTRNGETFIYTFEEWQLKALNHACIFLLKEARILTLSKMGIG